MTQGTNFDLHTFVIDVLVVNREDKLDIKYTDMQDVEETKPQEEWVE